MRAEGKGNSNNLYSPLFWQTNYAARSFIRDTQAQLNDFLFAHSREWLLFMAWWNAIRDRAGEKFLREKFLVLSRAGDWF